MARQKLGTCSACGKIGTLVTVVDEQNILCNACLDQLDYIECERCHEYWLWDAISFYVLKDSRTICQHCAEVMLQNGELAVKNIYDILDYTQNQTRK